MATTTIRDQAKKIPLFPLFSLLCFASIFLALSLSRRDFFSPQTSAFFKLTPRSTRPPSSASCDYSVDSWIYHPHPLRYHSTCKEIFKGWNCIVSNKSNAGEIPKWPWQPKSCDLPPFDPVAFLESFRNTKIGADSGFTFLSYNFTIAYHRTNLLARYGRWSANPSGGQLESLGYMEGYRVDVDSPEGTWADASAFHDILIFNTGHWWWAPSKFDPVMSPMLFFKDNQPLIPPIPLDVGLDMVLKHMSMHPNGIKFFRTQSSRHFEGGDWDQGGSCNRLEPLLPEQVEDLFSLKNNGTNVESRLVNQHIFNTLKSSNFHILNVTYMSEFRADAHPSTASGKKHDDCMHWCLPGIIDTWNDLFIMHLNSIKARN